MKRCGVSRGDLRLDLTMCVSEQHAQQQQQRCANKQLLHELYSRDSISLSFCSEQSLHNVCWCWVVASSWTRAISIREGKCIHVSVYACPCQSLYTLTKVNKLLGDPWRRQFINFSQQTSNRIVGVGLKEFCVLCKHLLDSLRPDSQKFSCFCFWEGPTLSIYYFYSLIDCRVYISDRFR